MGNVAGKQRAFRDLEVDKIRITELDLREGINQERLEGLASTVNEFGILQPILVSVEKNSLEYRLILGGRRLRAAKQLGLPTIPAFIVDDLQEKNALIMMLIENMQREDLEPLEESRGLAEMRERFNYSEYQIAQTIGKRAQFVQERLALLRLPLEIQTLIEQKKLGVSQAVEITRLEGDIESQQHIAKNAVDKNLASEVVKRMVDEITIPRRRYKKMARKHKLKKGGDPLSETHMKKKLQRVVLRGEYFLRLIDGIPLGRWNSENIVKLEKAIEALEQGLLVFRKRMQRAVKGERTKRDELDTANPKHD